ncbi:MAG: uncharacterized protein QOG54_2463 [Actinomycetota bacterium]|nr:uncharacterized protein [Actinomycetota bacterium]
MIELSLEQARRLAIRKQRLHETIKPTKAGIKDVARSLRVIQIDPINAVERTQNLVLWSRLGPYNRKHFEQLQWTDKFFFPYWAHAASMVLTEDLPLQRWRMKHQWIETSAWDRRIKVWMEENKRLRNQILRDLKKNDDLKARDFRDHSVSEWMSEGWNSGQNVARMLDFLWVMGKVTISGRDGLERKWSLTERWMPDWAPKESLPVRKAVEISTQHSLRALGVATAQHIKAHYTRGAYPDLPEVLAGLIKNGLVHPANVVGLPGKWFIHADDLKLIDKLDEPTGTTFLSPFDNLIADRKRTELMWDFNYRIEIYVPKAKRVYGYYALPILHGDRLVGRLDSRTDRAEGVLRVNAIHFEPTVKPTKKIGAGVSAALQRLADFVSDGNSELAPTAVPKAWRAAIH